MAGTARAWLWPTSAGAEWDALSSRSRWLPRAVCAEPVQAGPSDHSCSDQGRRRGL